MNFERYFDKKEIDYRWQVVDTRWLWAASHHILAKLRELEAENARLREKLADNERAYNEAYMISVAAKNDAAVLRRKADAFDVVYPGATDALVGIILRTKPNDR